MPSPGWEALRERFSRWVASSGVPQHEHARRLGVSPATLSRILTGATPEPRLGTQEKIRKYLKSELARNVMEADRALPHEYRFNEEDVTPGEVREVNQELLDRSDEEELLEYFLEHHEQMASFMTTATRGLTPEDRRKVALALLNGFKALATELGKPVPDVLFRLERRLVWDR